MKREIKTVAAVVYPLLLVALLVLIPGHDDLRVYSRLLTDLEIAKLGGLFADDFETGNVSVWALSVP